MSYSNPASKMMQMDNLGDKVSVFSLINLHWVGVQGRRREADGGGGTK